MRELAARYHIEILTINAVYPFNRRSEEVRQLTESLLKEAQPSAPNRWCSVRSTTAARCRPAKPRAPCATGAAVRLLWHPRHGGAAGLPAKLAAFCAPAQTLIHDARVPFKLLIDTFHHHLYPQAADEFSRVEVADIGLVHLSGVDDSRPREQLTDAERIMLTPQDRLGTCEQVKAGSPRLSGVYALSPSPRAGAMERSGYRARN